MEFLVTDIGNAHHALGLLQGSGGIEKSIPMFF